LVTEKDPELMKAHDLAVQETMQEIQKHYSLAHPNSQEFAESEGMVWISVRDGYSREHDPHLHTHIIIPNITKYKGKYMGLCVSKMMNPDFNKLWGAYYRNSLARKMKQLGYDISYYKGGEWRLDKYHWLAKESFQKELNRSYTRWARGHQKNAWRKDQRKKKSKE